MFGLTVEFEDYVPIVKVGLVEDGFIRKPWYILWPREPPKSEAIRPPPKTLDKPMWPMKPDNDIISSLVSVMLEAVAHNVDCSKTPSKTDFKRQLIKLYAPRVI